MPNYSQEDLDSGTSRSVTPSSKTTSPSRSPEIKHETPRRAPDHDFLVANMFGPVDWAWELFSDEEVAEPEPQPRSQAALETETKPKREDRLMEANMFGPMDWAMDLLEMERRDSIAVLAKA